MPQAIIQLVNIRSRCSRFHTGIIKAYVSRAYRNTLFKKAVRRSKMSDFSSAGQDESSNTSVKQIDQNSPENSKVDEDRTLDLKKPEVESLDQNSLESIKVGEDRTLDLKKPEVESLDQNSLERIKVGEDRILHLKEESEVESFDHLKETTKDLSPVLSDSTLPIEQSSKNEGSPKVLTKAMKSLSISDKSPDAKLSKDEERQTKPKSATPVKSKSRSRSTSTSNVFESPYNTRLKAKLLREKEQRSLSEDSKKRNTKQ